MKHTLLLLFSLVSTPLFANDVAQSFERAKSNPDTLYQWLKTMPKGGELHYHLAGGAYPETMLDLAANNPYCLNTHLFSVTNDLPCRNHAKSSKLKKNRVLYQDYVRAWSIKDFVEDCESKHDHFFNAFEKFMPIVNNHRPELLTKIVQRAANQHEQYLEVMAIPDNGRSLQFGQGLKADMSYQQRLNNLLGNAHFQANIRQTQINARSILEKTQKLLNCDHKPQNRACQIPVKFQYYTLRELPLNLFFAMAVNAFEVSNRSSDFVGINMVQPEDSQASLKNISEQMKILQFLHRRYPRVNIALHAGELTPDIVPAHELRYHIRDAINIAHAQRIGHGVDITHEDRATQLARQMAQQQIAVEINLSSNEFILSVSGKNHPLNYYLRHKVPVVLSTDDEGILRTDLTTQYLKAAIEHGLNYAQLKDISRNALQYSFLPGKSLWLKPYQFLQPECRQANSNQCRQFLTKNLKAEIQWRLEQAFNRFERKKKQIHSRKTQATKKPAKAG